MYDPTGARNGWLYNIICTNLASVCDYLLRSCVPLEGDSCLIQSLSETKRGKHRHNIIIDTI